MSKPKGKCAFCGKPGDLTKSHIWPEWAEAILPQTATHHRQTIGEFHTFKPVAKGPEYFQKVRQGHVGTRKPRNTCKKCNSEWMRLIEENTIPFLDSLILSKPYALDIAEQQMLAALLCLVSMRLEVAWRDGPKGIPQSDREWLMDNPEPPANWKIWIGKYGGPETTMDQQHTPMQIVSSPDVTVGVEHCNTQVTTLVVGQFYAHLFSSTAWKDFPGYEGIDLVQLWPITHRIIPVLVLPTIAEQEVVLLHETIPRTTKQIPS
jgi:hypothetical protein